MNNNHLLLEWNLLDVLSENRIAHTRVVSCHKTVGWRIFDTFALRIIND